MTASQCERVTAGIGMQEPQLEFTGERIVPGKTAEALFKEHEDRYVFAGQFVLGKDVLDVACGSGIGTDYLRTAGASQVFGIDVDAHVIEYAKASYVGCTFMCGDASLIDLPDSSVDVVVSFETIEHLREPQQFLRECHRVLRPEGRLLCSTPNKDMYKWQGQNPFHTREFTADEFLFLTSSYFCDVTLFSQLEYFYPVYWARCCALQALKVLKIKKIIKSLLSSPRLETARRSQFTETAGTQIHRYQPRRWSLKRPMYFVAVARKEDK